MSSIENVINLFFKESAQQPLVSNPPYVGDQLENKDESVEKKAKRIFFLDTSKHFLRRMKERDINEDTVKDVISLGVPKFQNVPKGTMEFVKDDLKVVMDVINKKLITVMHRHEKEAALYDAISDIENFVLAASEIRDDYKSEFAIEFEKGTNKYTNAYIEGASIPVKIHNEILFKIKGFKEVITEMGDDVVTAYCTLKQSHIHDPSDELTYKEMDFRIDEFKMDIKGKIFEAKSFGEILQKEHRLDDIIADSRLNEPD